MEEIKKKSEDINRKIEKRRAKIQKFTHKERDIINRLNQADRLLNRSRKRVSALERKISRIEAEIAETTRSSEILMQQIKVNEEYVASRMVALYKLKWLGTIHVLASAESLHELLQRKTAIERILTYDQQVIAELMANRMDLKTVQSQLEAQRDTKRQRAAEHQNGEKPEPRNCFVQRVAELGMRGARRGWPCGARALAGLRSVRADLGCVGTRLLDDECALRSVELELQVEGEVLILPLGPDALILGSGQHAVAQRPDSLGIDRVGQVLGEQALPALRIGMGLGHSGLACECLDAQSEAHCQEHNHLVHHLLSPV